MVHLNYRDARPIYTQIFDGFRDQILTGVLRQGDKLPSVRELATCLRRRSRRSTTGSRL